ncbi:glucosaminidase domain-containing protein [Lactobacillus terrae]|uniref:glucosaminidase domain-containing protein n=1 Tax=Lactobacillus terrae TaxID=2269374 RepID=UPI000C1B660D|nr:glucosaminidase domain-containing protein [Lactobacillus terrae]
MTISRIERIKEENRLYKFNNKKRKSATLKKNISLIGAGLFFGGAVAQTTSTTSVTVHAASNNTTAVANSKGSGDTQFIDYIGNSARKLAQNNDIYASVMIAQAMIESGWGTSGLASAPNYNLFGIKGTYQGDAVNMATQEDDGSGKLYGINSNFKKYPSYKESLEDYVSLIRGGISGNPQFYAGTWKSNTDSYEEATAFLTGKYATDTTYATKLNAMIEKYDLTRFDEADDTSNTQEYVVQEGDTLDSIATAFDMSKDDLVSLNELKTENYVFPGKTLLVDKINDSSNNDIKDMSVLNVQNSTSDEDTTDAYGTQQAPVIVQDETNGVVIYSKSHNSKNAVINVQNTIDSSASSSNNSSNYLDQNAEDVWTQGSQEGMTSTEITNSDDSALTQSAADSKNEALNKADTANDLKSVVSSTLDQPKYTVVEEGDSWATISNRVGVSVADLKQKNNITSEILVVGQKLLV